MKKFQLNINRYELENTISSYYVGTLFHECWDIYFVFTSFGRENLGTAAYRLYSEFNETTCKIIESTKENGWKHEIVEVDAQIELSQLPICLKAMSCLESEINKACEFIQSELPSAVSLKAYEEFGEWS